MLLCGARTKHPAGPPVARDTEQKLQQSRTADGMEHFERIEAPPLPVLDPFALGALSEPSDGTVGGGTEQLVVGFVGRWQPFCGAVGKDFLQEGGTAPVVKTCVLAKVRFEQKEESDVTRVFEERDQRRISVGNAVPILHLVDQFLRPGIFGPGGFYGGKKLLRGEGGRIHVKVGFHFWHGFRGRSTL